jgi:Trypsin-like peptidase domain
VPVVPLSARVVEVIADLGEAARPRYRYGSGCVVAGRTVLTAAHVVEGAVGVKVRDSAKVMHEAALDPVFVGDVNGPRPDLALVEITALEIDMPAMGLAAVDRNSVSGDPVERCHAVGYPAFMERRTPAGDPFRESVDAFGHVPVLSFLATGLLSVQVSSAPRELPPEQTKLGESEWSGMSGGPVVAGGLLLGVVTEQAPRAGPAAITATPLTALEADPARPGWGPGWRIPERGGLG